MKDHATIYQLKRECPFCRSSPDSSFDPSGGTSPLSKVPCIRVSTDRTLYTGSPVFMVICDVCGARGPTKPIYNEAVKAWESRS